MADQKISQLTAGTPLDTDIIPYVDLVSGETKKALKSELKGANGADGDDAYVYIAYASADDGTDFTLTFNSALNYIAIKHTTVAISNPVASDFTGLWKNYKGADGTGSGDISGSGTANEIAYFTAEKTIDNLPVATYPSLAELAYVKGVTSAIQTQLGGKVATNSAITGATKTKITYDAKGLVTAGEDATTADIADSLNKRYVTDADLVDIGNLSGTNSGDNAANTSSIAKSLVDAKGDLIVATGSDTVDRLAVGTNGYVLTADSGEATGLKWAAAAGGGASLWTAPSGATRVSNTTFTVTGDQTAIFKKGLIIKWTESSTVRCAMVSIPSTVSTDTTVTIIGDTMASIDSGSLKYCLIGAEGFIKEFAVAGTIGATATDVSRAYYATEPMRVLGADLSVGTAGTTNNTTVDLNKAGTTIFTTKPTLATTVASSPTPFTADTTSALALGDKVTLDIDAIQSTPSVDLYCQLYLFPSRYLTLS